MLAPAWSPGHEGGRERRELHGPGAARERASKEGERAGGRARSAREGRAVDRTNERAARRSTKGAAAAPRLARSRLGAARRCRKEALRGWYRGRAVRVAPADLSVPLARRRRHARTLAAPDPIPFCLQRPV
eukprot:scaffold1926_cov305-Prasinococcus_capsulatus_cf.AAC.5